jgi:DNA-binding beta-propeller fold protein YncE
MAAIGLHGVGYLAIDAQDVVYVADIEAGRIIKLTALGEVLQFWGGAGRGQAAFDGVNGIAVDATGTIYVTEELSSQVRKLSPAGDVLAVWGKEGTERGQLRHPRGLAVDRHGNVLVADAYNSRIQVFSPGGETVGVWGESHGDTRDTLWTLDRPADVAIGPRGQVYVADTRNGRVHKFASDGRLLSIWVGDFRCPEGICVDRYGYVYVADSGHGNRVIKLSPSGAWLAVWQTSPPRDGGEAYIQGVAVNRRGSIFVTEYTAESGPRVVKLTSTGQIRAIWQ